MSISKCCVLKLKEPDTQVEYFWKAGRWSLSRILFFLVRPSACVPSTSSNS